MHQSIYLKCVVSVSILLVGFSAVPLVTRHAQPPSVLTQIQQQGELVVVTRNSPTTYYEASNGPAGFEYELAHQFADYLGVRLKIITVENFNEILPTVARRNAHLAAAGLTVSTARKKQVHFGPSYQDITQQLVYRDGGERPHNTNDLANGLIEVVAGSSHAAKLRTLNATTPGLHWQASKHAGVSELLTRVWNKSLDYTIADSNEIQLYQRFYPELHVAFDLTEPQQLAWAFPKGGDDSLYQEAVKFFAHIKANGQLAQLKDRHYLHTQKLNYVGKRIFSRHIKNRLPRYLSHFKQAARNNALDWRLLAAIGYQESHWNHRAISPTGVRGIMMLTRSTAADMGFRNRIKPQNSINGGARYFARLKKSIPASISEPDRTWFALAAYNLGLGHIKDVRKITAQRGGNPDKWFAVRKNLPLLMQKRWYRRTRHGYARGVEAQRYVENIRSYYDILQWRNRARMVSPTLLVKYPAVKTAYSLSPIL